MPIDFSAIARGAKDKLDNSGLKPYLLPAAVGALAGGPLMAYAASKDHNQDESPKERRHRILRKALLGLTMGGVAGAAIPAGAKMVGDAVNPAGFHPGSTAQNFAFRHAGAGVAGGVGGTWAWHNLGKNRALAAENIAGTLSPSTNPTRPGGSNTELEAIMTRAQNPHTQKSVIDDLAQRISGKAKKNPLEEILDPTKSPNTWEARERLQEAGVKNIPGISAAANPEEKAKLLEDLSEHLKGQGFFSNLAAKSIPAMEGLKTRLGDSAIGKMLPESHAIAENFSKYVRPSVSGRLGFEGPRFGAVPAAMMVGGAMLGANALQNKIMSND